MNFEGNKLNNLIELTKKKKQTKTFVRQMGHI